MHSFVISEQRILEKYTIKSGLDLSKEIDIDELNDSLRLTLIASENKEVFYNYGSLNSWLYLKGKLILNSLYHEFRKDKTDDVIYKIQFPSEWFEFENKDWLKFAPEEIKLSQRVWNH